METSAEIQRARRDMAHVPWHPLFFGSTFVIGQYLDLLLHPADLLRPLAVTLAVTLLFLLAATAVFRSTGRGALVTSGLLVVLLSKPLVQAMATLVERQPLVAGSLIGVAALSVAIGVRILRRRGISLAAITGGLNTFAGLLLLVVVVSAVPSGFPAALVPDLTSRTADAQPTAGDPNIYVVLLDAYPGANTLERVFDYDNQEFLAELEDRGLDHAESARANYWFTSLTLASLFHMRPVTEVPALASVINGRSSPDPHWRQAIGDAPAFDFLRGRGYRLTSVGSGWADVAVRSADSFVDGGQLNDFETHLIRSTFAVDLIEVVNRKYFVQQQRQRIDSVFDAVISASTGESTFPRFVFGHVPAPHPPLAVTATGTDAEWPNADTFYGITTSQLGVTPEEYGRRFLEQLKYVNRRTLEVVDAIVQADEKAVVVVMSDHGPGHPADGPAPEEVDARARLFNLMAVRHPGREGLIPEDVSPVNLFPRLFNAYFGTDLPYHANTSYRSSVFGTDEMFHELEPIPEWELTDR